MNPSRKIYHIDINKLNMMSIRYIIKSTKYCYFPFRFLSCNRMRSKNAVISSFIVEMFFYDVYTHIFI